jgi:hypothetical protein
MKTTVETREFKAENTTLFIGIFAILCTLAFMNSAKASVKTINCETAFGEKSFTIQESTIAFHKKSAEGRSISSVLGARTQRTYSGFRKTLYVNGNKHLIHIENQKKLDNTEDFMAVTSPKGHKMTYPLTCSII